MLDNNKAILEEANAAISEGNNEGYLSFCADDTKWTFVGDRTLNGKENSRHNAIYADFAAGFWEGSAIALPSQ